MLVPPAGPRSGLARFSARVRARDTEVTFPRLHVREVLLVSVGTGRTGNVTSLPRLGRTRLIEPAPTGNSWNKQARARVLLVYVVTFCECVCV